MPRPQWDALVRGEGCPLCANLALHVQTNAHIRTVTDLDLSRLWLAANQSVPGYCMLVCKKHVREPYDLPKEERVAFLEDMMRAAQAIERVFNPIKMNFEILGNAIPHLHCHIKPRYYGVAAPGRPIHPDAHPHFLTQPDYEQRAALLRAALLQS